MDCYHCQHAEAIARGDYAGASWQDTPCFGCGSDTPLPPYRESGRIDERRVADGRPGPADEAAAADVEPGVYPLAVLSKALEAVLRLETVDFEILRMRRDRRSWEEIGLTVGMEVEACQMRMTRLVRREPVLVELVPALKGKLARRALRNG